MPDEPGYTTDTARAAAERDELNDWVRQFLASPGSDNAALGHALTDPPRWWLGPVEVPLDQLNRLAGPAGHPVLEVVEDHEWRDDVDDLARRIEGGLEPAPVVTSYRDDELILEDGNHRAEALRRAERECAWTIVGFDDAEQRDHFIERTGSRES